MNNIKLLDVTLRDGGYVNNWEFDTDSSRAIIDGLYSSGIKDIEIGILGNGAKPGLQTKFNNFDEIKPILENKKYDCNYYVMFTQENAGDFLFPIHSKETPDSVRIAYFKKSWRESIALACSLKEKGYKVFLQAMATFMYSEKELAEMIEEINLQKIDAFYLVDSFSTMYPNDVIRLRDFILSILDPNVVFGFHAHNNLQMAFSNVQAFISGVQTRELYVDASIFGMGRGAGNVPTELLANFLNTDYHGAYSVSKITNIFQKYLLPIYKEYGWGYTMPYFLTAKEKMNSAYGWYFTSHGVTDLDLLESALKMVPTEIKYTLNHDVAKMIVERIK